MRAKILIFAALAIILGVPFALRPQASRDESQRDAVRLIIVTPHIEQIRFEFAAGFDRWHRRVHGRPAVIDWRTPGGTSEIIKLLQAQYTAAIKRGVVDHRDPRNVVVPAGAIGFDLMFGGGSFDHTRLKLGDGVEAVNAVSADLHGPPHVFRVPMSVPTGFTQEFLDRVFGENRIGNQPLYDPEQFWIGTALSSFGIVYNRDALAKLGVPEPDSFEDLTDPRLAGWVALADPRQSGSVTTTLDSILNNYGWERGWRILREMAANTRYFTNSAPKPPLDISAGEAAAGLAIDFYGRGQAQAIGDNRLGYVDPVGTTYIDADPVSLLRGGPHPEIARRFVEFCLTDEAQALWQFPAHSRPEHARSPLDPSGRHMGPERYELRRMPVRRSMYERYVSLFADQTDPFAVASETQARGWRAAIGPMMGSFAIDIADDVRSAWLSLNAARAAPGFPPEVLAEMERLFYAWPATPIPGRGELAFTPENFRIIRDRWRDADAFARLRIEYTTFFRQSYRRVTQLARQHGVRP